MKIFKEVEATYRGYNFLLRNIGYEEIPSLPYSPHNWWCGYVELQEGDEYYDKDYHDIPIACHGGLTFKGKIHDKMYIGFDCNHYLDDPFVEDEAYCTHECKFIIKQLLERGDDDRSEE